MIERKKIYYETEILNKCTTFDKIIKDIIDVITINILKMFIFSLISNYLVLSIHDCWFAYYKHGKIDSIRVNPTLKIEQQRNTMNIAGAVLFDRSPFKFAKYYSRCTYIISTNLI